MTCKVISFRPNRHDETEIEILLEGDNTVQGITTYGKGWRYAVDRMSEDT
jgi:hypothetical protein